MAFDGIWLVLRLVSVMKLVLILYRPASIQKNVIWLKRINVGLYSDIYWQISFKLGMTIETTLLNIFIG